MIRSWRIFRLTTSQLVLGDGHGIIDLKFSSGKLQHCNEDGGDDVNDDGSNDDTVQFNFRLWH